MGDSVTFGWGVNDWECYPSQLQTFLDRWFPGRFEVINAGIPGYSSFQAYHYYEQVVADLDPDVVIIGYGINDNRIRDWRFYGKSEEEIWAMRRGGFTRITRILEHFHLYKVFRYGYHRMILARTFLPDQVQPQRRVPPESYKHNLAKLMGKLKETNIFYILFIEPIARPFPGYGEYVEILRNFNSLYSVPLCDGFELFNCEHILKKSPEFSSWDFRGNGNSNLVIKINPELKHLFGQDPLHPNDDGYTIIANCLFDLITNMFPDVEPGDSDQP
jgi:lysophospholipase L1-like esterase